MSTIEELKAENEALRAQVRELLQRLDMVVRLALTIGVIIQLFAQNTEQVQSHHVDR